MDGCIDNVFEWLLNEKTACVTFSQKRFVSKLKKYAQDYPEDVEIISENDDGSICAHVPVSWFKFSPPRKGREFTEEEKQAAAKRLADARQRKRMEMDEDE